MIRRGLPLRYDSFGLQLTLQLVIQSLEKDVELLIERIAFF